MDVLTFVLTVRGVPGLPSEPDSYWTKMLKGELNWLTPLPREPKLVHPAPVISLTRTMRLLPASATKICPVALTTMPIGLLSWLMPLPRLPKVVQPAPVMSLIRTMRLLLPSATKICPAALTTMPNGLLNWLMPLPTLPKVVQPPRSCR